MLAHIGVMLSDIWPWLADVGAMLRPGQAILRLYDGPFGLCWAQVETMLGYVGATYSKLHIATFSGSIGPCWTLLELCCGLSWRHAGTILAHVAAHVTICWSHVGAWLPYVGPRPCHVGGLCWAHVGHIYVAPKLANVVAMLAMLRQNSFSQKRPFRLGESDILRLCLPFLGP